jgi:putative molybdopterin biosynthesis protein
MAEIETSLGELRRKRGFSAAQLASVVGVSRQTIYAMEAGTYVPNTAVALRLARALDCAVEELFALRDSLDPRKLRSERVLLLPDSALPSVGEAVQLCQVDDRLVASSPSPVSWLFPTTDAVVTDEPQRPARARVQIFQEDANFSNRILVAGCDPGISVLSRHVQALGIELVLAQRNSSQALSLLKHGCIHVAGTHLTDDVSGESNLPQVRQLFPKTSVAVISFAVWEEGILTPADNPKNIRGIEDFARKDVSIVNREEGSGSRALLDKQLKRAGIEPRNVRGYDYLASGHVSAAWQIRTGTADCCLATRGTARLLGLHFLPLLTERYDLVIRKQHLDLPRMQNLFDTLTRLGFRRELEGFGGYDTRVAGQRVL